MPSALSPEGSRDGTQLLLVPLEDTAMVSFHHELSTPNPCLEFEKARYYSLWFNLTGGPSTLTLGFMSFASLLELFRNKLQPGGSVHPVALAPMFPQQHNHWRQEK